MAEMAALSSVEPSIRLTAVSLTQSLPQHGFLEEIAACGAYVRDHIRYVKDVVGVETLHWPKAVLELGSGDCDDKAMLLASLLMSIGHECRFVVLKRNRSWCHVWTQARCRGKWIDLDTTLNRPLGQTVPGRKGDELRFLAVKPYDYSRRYAIVA